MKHSRITARLAGSILASIPLFLGACSGGSSGGSGAGGGGSGMGTLALQVTDDAFAYDIVTAATISVDKITIFHEADSDDGPLVLYEGTPILMDLFHLHDGLMQPLDPATLPVGNYHQLRLRVTNAHLELTNGNVYDSDDGSIHLTSQDTSGFKVNFDPAIVISDGETENVLLDFDLTHTFHPIPANDALNADHYSLHPVIHVSNLGHTGGIQGTITQSDGAGGLVPVDAATVYVFPPGQTDPTLAVATTSSSPAGTYSVLGIQPGSYDVQAVKGALSALATGVTIVSGEMTTVDLTINDGTGGVQGVVTQSDGAGGSITVPGANVYVLPPGVTDPAQAVATGVTGANGAYSFTGILAGTYDVRAVLGTLNGTAANVAIVAGSTAVANISINDGTGGVSGVVTQDNGAGGTMPVAGATVYVLPPGVTDPTQALATGLTAVDGSYTLTGILAGTYDVRAVMAALSGTAAGVVIDVGANTVANVLIQ